MRKMGLGPSSLTLKFWWIFFLFHCPSLLLFLPLNSVLSSASFSLFFFGDLIPFQEFSSSLPWEKHHALFLWFLLFPMVCWIEKCNWSFGLNMPKRGSIFSLLCLLTSSVPYLWFWNWLLLITQDWNLEINTFDMALSHHPHLIKVQMLSIWPSPHLSVHTFLIIPTLFPSFRNLCLDCFKNYNFKHNKWFKTREENQS